MLPLSSKTSFYEVSRYYIKKNECCVSWLFEFKSPKDFQIYQQLNQHVVLLKTSLVSGRSQLHLCFCLSQVLNHGER